MGWTAGKLAEPFTAEACLRFEFGDDFLPRVVASARKGTVIYAAVRDAHNTHTFGLVLLAERTNGILYTKPITEDMGPSEDECPERILRLLTSPSNDRAREWRQRCRENLARVKPVKHDLVDFGRRLTFSNGDQHQVLRYLGGSRFSAYGAGPIYSVPNWRREYKWRTVK